MAIRRQLLERELSKLGVRKADAGRATSSDGPGQQEGQSSHPQADHSDQHGE